MVAVGPRTLFASAKATAGAGGVTIGDSTGPRPDLYPGWTPVVPGQIQFPNHGFGLTPLKTVQDGAYYTTDRPVPPEAVFDVSTSMTPAIEVWWLGPVISVQVAIQASINSDSVIISSNPLVQNVAGSIAWDISGASRKLIGATSDAVGRGMVYVTRAGVTSPPVEPPIDPVPPQLPKDRRLRNVKALLVTAQNQIDAALELLENL